MDRLGPLLKQMLRARRISQNAFAKLVGVSGPTITNIIHGRIAPRNKHAPVWCRVLGLSRRDARRLTLAMHLAAASPLVRAYVRTLERGRHAVRAKT